MDPEGAYRMRVSDQWEANHGAFATGIEVWYIGPLEGLFRPNINVLTQETGTMDLDAYTRLSIDNAGSIVQEFELIETVNRIGETGTELAVTEYRGRVGGSPLLHFLAVWTVNDGQAIVVTLTATPETFEAHRRAWLPYILTVEPA